MNKELYEKTFSGYRSPNQITIPRYQAIQAKVKELGDLIMEVCPDSREKSIALTDLQSCRMFANAAIAIHTEE
jgi:hypothetical protein